MKDEETFKLPEMPKRSTIKYEMIGNCFSKDSFILITKIAQDGKETKETFHANKFPCFLSGLLKTDPDAYAHFLNKAINVLNAD